MSYRFIVIMLTDAIRLSSSRRYRLIVSLMLLVWIAGPEFAVTMTTESGHRSSVLHGELCTCILRFLIPARAGREVGPPEYLYRAYNRFFLHLRCCAFLLPLCVNCMESVSVLFGRTCLCFIMQKLQQRKLLINFLLSLQLFSGRDGM